MKNRPILMKFGTLHQILNPFTVTDQKLKFLEFKMVATAVLKIAFFQQLVDRLSDFGEILFAQAERHADKGHMTKTANF